tara:strand:+ start:400 stop:663 length:264 start_codon:yes stop_codon:yes gene_type:complete
MTKNNKFEVLIDSAHLFTGEEQIWCIIKPHAREDYYLRREYRVQKRTPDEENYPDHINLELKKDVYLTVPISIIESIDRRKFITKDN